MSLQSIEAIFEMLSFLRGLIFVKIIFVTNLNYIVDKYDLTINKGVDEEKLKNLSYRNYLNKFFEGSHSINTKINMQTIFVELKEKFDEMVNYRSNSYDLKNNASIIWYIISRKIEASVIPVRIGKSLRNVPLFSKNLNPYNLRYEFDLSNKTNQGIQSSFLFYNSRVINNEIASRLPYDRASYYDENLNFSYRRLQKIFNDLEIYKELSLVLQKFLRFSDSSSIDEHNRDILRSFALFVYSLPFSTPRDKEGQAQLYEIRNVDEIINQLKVGLFENGEYFFNDQTRIPDGVQLAEVETFINSEDPRQTFVYKILDRYLSNFKFAFKNNYVFMEIQVIVLDLSNILENPIIVRNVSVELKENKASKNLKDTTGGKFYHCEFEVESELIPVFIFSFYIHIVESRGKVQGAKGDLAFDLKNSKLQIKNAVPYSEDEEDNAKIDEQLGNSNFSLINFDSSVSPSFIDFSYGRSRSATISFESIENFEELSTSEFLNTIEKLFYELELLNSFYHRPTIISRY
jgi:hypothetical protein